MGGRGRRVKVNSPCYHSVPESHFILTSRLLQASLCLTRLDVVARISVEQRRRLRRRWPTSRQLDDKARTVITFPPWRVSSHERQRERERVKDRGRSWHDTHRCSKGRPFGPENFTDNGDTYGMTNDAASLLIPEVRRR